MSDTSKTAGVQELIDRLSQEGVAEGQQRAKELILEAQRKAEQIVEVAHEEAASLLQKSQQDADKYRQAGEAALQLAARDAVRDFGARVHDGLRSRLQELVQHELKDPDLLKQMILQITHQASEDLQENQLEIMLPEESVTEEEVRDQVEAGKEDALTDFVKGILGEDLRDGVFVSLGNQPSGLVVRVLDEHVEIDLTDDAIAELLAKHLLPRFRGIMRQAANSESAG